MRVKKEDPRSIEELRAIKDDIDRRLNEVERKAWALRSQSYEVSRRIHRKENPPREGDAE